MSQTIHCQSCQADSVARGVADLIDRHTNEKGRFCCTRCGGTETYLVLPARRGAARAAKSWVRGIVPIDTKTRDAACVPFVFLTAPAPDGEIDGLAFRYYWTTPSNGDRKKRTRRPDGGPVMAQSQLLSLVRRLARIQVVSSRDWREFLRADSRDG
jgi:hypothetical protein